MGKAYRCPGCKSTIEETSGEILVCSFCGRQYKNPDYRPRGSTSLPISVTNPLDSSSRGSYPYDSGSRGGSRTSDYRDDYSIGYDDAPIGGYRGASYAEEPMSRGYASSTRGSEVEDSRVRYGDIRSRDSYREDSPRGDYREDGGLRGYGDSSVGGYPSRGDYRGGRDYGVDSEVGYGTSGYASGRSGRDTSDKRDSSTRPDVSTIRIIGDEKARSVATERISTGSSKDRPLSVDEISAKMKSTLKEIQDLVKEMERLSQLLESRKH